MKYTNKKSNILVLILSALLFCGFTGCSNINTKETKQIIVTGKIRSENQTILKNQKIRSAATSYTFTESHKIRVYASRSLGDLPAGNVEGTVTDDTYSIILDAAGTWTIYLSVYAPSILGSDSDIFTLQKEVTVDEKATSLIAPDFVITSDYGTLHNGGINLTFTDESNKIASMSYFATFAAGGSPNENSFAEVATAQFVNHSLTLNLDDISPNNYEMTFSFKDSAGNELYKCKESVPVVAGFITDTWIGDGAHLRFDNDLLKTEFVITDELIEIYGAEVTPETNYLLYNHGSENAEYYSIDDLETFDPETADIVNISKNIKNQYAFDKDGNVYFLQSTGGNNVIIQGENSIPFADGININRILIDRKTNILYGVLINQQTLEFYRFDKFISGPEDDRNENTKITSFSFPSDTFGSYYYHDQEILTMYDGIVFGCKNEGKIFYKLDLNKSYAYAEKIELPLNEYIDSAGLMYGEFSDIIYQEGYVFILFRHVYEDSSVGVDFYSRGGVICFNTFTNAIENVIGWTEDSMSNSGKYTYLNYSGLVKKVVPAEVDDESYYVLASASDIVDKETSNSLFNIYSPEYEDDGFYGPEKFIALKPKKLVIADNGMAYYTDDNDAYRVKNLNRVVIVDLETFALESAVIDESIKFASETTNGSGYLAGNGCMYSSISSDTTLYKSTDKSEMTSTEIDSLVDGKRDADWQGRGMFPDIDIGGGIPAIPFDTTNLEF